MSWQYSGRRRPSFAFEPGPGQESVWDFPRPPRCERDAREVVVALGDTEIARTRRALRVLETASPPTFYVPRDDIRLEFIEPAAGHSFCEWKGTAVYWSVLVGQRRLPRVAWSYPDPTPPYAALRDCFAFYPAALDCSVDGERVQPQPGRFYGGWITADVVGPFKGEPGSEGW